VDKNLKLVMGLVWTLILHYNLGIPIAADKTDGINGHGGDGVEGVPPAQKQQKVVKISPKQRLLQWIQQKLEGEEPRLRVTVTHSFLLLFLQIAKFPLKLAKNHRNSLIFIKKIIFFVNFSQKIALFFSKLAKKP
jgi:hypothetical protein